jgi:hypothetical protein
VDRKTHLDQVCYLVEIPRDIQNSDMIWFFMGIQGSRRHKNNFTAG